MRRGDCRKCGRPSSLASSLCNRCAGLTLTIGDVYTEFVRMQTSMDEVHKRIEYETRRVPARFPFRTGQRWYEVEKGVWPHKSVSECRACGKALQPGDVAYIDRIAAGETFAWYVVHKACLAAVFEDAPQESFEQIQQRLREGGDLFG